MTATEISSKLNDLTRGLIYISESESPLEVLPWVVKNEDDLLRQVATFCSVPVTKLQRQDAAAFFAAIQQMANPDDEAITAYISRYQALHDFLTRHTERMQIIKVGQGRVQVFITGFLPAGALVLHTVAVET